MGNWIYYKEEQPVNLDKCYSTSKSKEEAIIIFDAYEERIIWTFSEKNIRDHVFEVLKSKMVDVGFLFPLKNPTDKLDDCQHDWIRLADIDGSQQVKCKKCGYKKAISVGF